MFLPLSGLVLSTLFWSLVGGVVLLLLRVRSGRLRVLAAFVAAAHLGFIGYAMLHGLVVSAPDGQLRSTAAVLTLLGGGLVAGLVAGVFAARAVLARRKLASDPS